MAFEAISRGAQHAYVWEILRPGANTIRKFAEELGISDQVTILAEDTFRWSKPLENGVVELLKRTGNPNGIAAPWLVFCCPPYSLWESQGGQLKDLLSDWASLAPKQSLFAVELEQKTEEHYLPESLSWDIRTYSPAKIAVAEV